MDASAEIHGEDMTIINDIAAIAAGEFNYTTKLVSALNSGGVNVKDALNKLSDFAVSASGNLEIYPRFFDSIYNAMVSMRSIGKGCARVSEEYDNIAYMSFNMLEDAAASGSTNMQAAVDYLQQFLR